MIESINNLIAKTKLIRVIKDRPVLKKIAGREKDESQYKTAQDVILYGPSAICPEDYAAESR